MDREQDEEAGVVPLRAEEKTVVTRRFQVWPSKNKFFCGGRIMTGAQPSSCIVTLVIIIAPTAGFLFSTVPALQRHSLGYAAAVPACFILLFLLFAMFRTAVCDPGIIPRREGFLDDKMRKLIPRAQGVVINGRVVTLKYCVTCNIYRPPRCSHCRLCDNCVDRFDHHCPWVGNCIGRRNYRWFLTFVLTAVFFAVYVILWGLVAMFLVGKETAPAGDLFTLIVGAKKLSMTTSVVIFSCLSLMFTGTLSFFHLYLASVNMTTSERMKGQSYGGSGLYSRGCQDNFREILCDPVPQPALDPLERMLVDRWSGTIFAPFLQHLLLCLSSETSLYSSLSVLMSSDQPMMPVAQTGPPTVGPMTGREAPPAEGPPQNHLSHLPRL